MNVFDRIIPNKAASSLWVLGVGDMLAFSLDVALRIARSRLVDEAGREIDERLSQRRFEKVLNTPLSDRSCSTGALARRVRGFESVRELFPSTTVVRVVGIALLLIGGTYGRERVGPEV